MNRLIILDICIEVDGESLLVHPVVLSNEKEMIMFDCGYINTYEILCEQFKINNLDISKLTKIYITHHDHDHVGNLFELKQKNKDLKVISSSIEKEYIELSEEPIRVTQAKDIQDKLPKNLKSWGQSFLKRVSSIKKVDVDEIVVDMQEIIFNNESIIVVATPGHLDGHLSFYLKDRKTLITGDALVYENNVLSLAALKYCNDVNEAKRSVAKLLAFDIDVLICYHGGLVNNDIKNRLNNIVN